MHEQFHSWFSSTLELEAKSDSVAIWLEKTARSRSNAASLG
jgi:hypothetical protein